MSDPEAPDPPGFTFGDSTVIVDHNTSVLAWGNREFSFRVKRLGTVTVYRVEVPEVTIARMNQRELAEYLLRHARHRSRLFTYRQES